MNQEVRAQQVRAQLEIAAEISALQNTLTQSNDQIKNIYQKIKVQETKADRLEGKLNKLYGLVNDHCDRSDKVIKSLGELEECGSNLNARKDDLELAFENFSSTIENGSFSIQELIAQVQKFKTDFEKTESEYNALQGTLVEASSKVESVKKLTNISNSRQTDLTVNLFTQVKNVKISAQTSLIPQGKFLVLFEPSSKTMKTQNGLSLKMSSKGSNSEFVGEIGSNLTNLKKGFLFVEANYQKDISFADVNVKTGIGVLKESGIHSTPVISVEGKTNNFPFTLKHTQDIKTLSSWSQNIINNSGTVTKTTPQEVSFDASGDASGQLAEAITSTKFSHILSVAPPVILAPTRMPKGVFDILTLLPLIAISWFCAFGKNQR